MRGNFGLILAGVIGIIISLVMFTVAVGQLDTAMTTADPIEIESSGVSTAVGVTSANVTLGDGLWLGLVTNVVSISSNETETPTANTYLATPRTLNVTSLTANITRTLTISYYNQPPIFTSLVSIMGIYGIIFWVAITGSSLALLGFGVYGAVKSGVGGTRDNKAGRRRRRS